MNIYYFFPKLTDSVTAIISGTNDPSSIITIDWRTMNYNVLPVKLSGNRKQGCCGLLRKKNDQLLVAVAGDIEFYIVCHRFRLLKRVDYFGVDFDIF